MSCEGPTGVPCTAMSTVIRLTAALHRLPVIAFFGSGLSLPYSMDNVPASGPLPEQWQPVVFAPLAFDGPPLALDGPY